MIIAERQIHHRADDDLTADHDRTLLDLVHAQNTRLRGIEDRGRHQRAIDTTIGDGEGAALHVGHRQLPIAGLPAEIADFLFDLGDRHLVGIAHHRNHKALVGADSDADMGVLLVDQVIAIDLGIDRRDFLERMHHGLGEKAHEAQLDAMLLLEQVLVLVAQVHHRLHVHLVEGGQHGGGVLRILEAARNGLAQAGDLHALFARRVIGGNRSARRGRRRRSGGLCSRSRSGGRSRRGGGRRTGQGREHIFLEHLTRLAGTGNAGGVEIVLVDQLLRRGSRSPVGRLDRLGTSSIGGRNFGLGRCRSGSGGRRGGSSGTGSNGTQQCPDIDGFARLGSDGFENA